MNYITEHKKSKPTRPRVLEGNDFDRQALLDINNSEFAKLFYVQFGIAEAKDLMAGFTLQMTYELFLYNLEDCTFWASDAWTDMYYGILLLVEENRPLDSFISFTYGIHKAPIAFYQCRLLIYDTEMMIYFYQIYSQTAEKWGP